MDVAATDEVVGVGVGVGVIDAEEVTAGTAPEGIAVAGMTDADGAANSDAAQSTCAEGQSFTRGKKGGPYLADVDVAAVRVDLGVVRVEHRRVDAVVRDDLVARVAALHDVRRRAVHAGRAKAELLAGQQVVARRVNTGVRHRKLVAGEWLVRGARGKAAARTSRRCGWRR